MSVVTRKKVAAAGTKNFFVAASKHGFADYEDCNVIRVTHVSEGEGPHWVCLSLSFSDINHVVTAVA